MKCKLCQSKNIFVLGEYPTSPSSAQNFLKSKKQDNDYINLRIMQCTNCGVIQHHEAPVNYYKKVIRAIAFSPEMRKFRVEQLQNWGNKNNLFNKNIIEIGCGAGEYLDILNEVGFKNIFGMEYSIENLKKINKTFTVYRNYLSSNFELDKKLKFDAFLSFSFMEHWPNPRKGLDKLLEITNENAQGIIEVPNFDLINEKKLFTEFIIDHIFYFTKDTLHTFLSSNGFDVINIDTIWHDYILSAKVKKRRALDFSLFNKQYDLFNYEFKKFNDSINNDKYVVWGAGHQSLSVISLLNLRENIDFIVDSALFKQNTYAPGSMLPIYDPSYLAKKKIKNLLIIAAGFNEEIKNNVIKNYKFISNVALLNENKIIFAKRS